MNFKALKINWKTTAAGLGVIFTALWPAITAATDGIDATEPNWNLVFTAVIAGIGLIFTRDADKSSEDSNGN